MQALRFLGSFPFSLMIGKSDRKMMLYQNPARREKKKTSHMKQI